MANGEALTDEGRKKLEEELAWREGEHRTEIVERIKVARDFGDLSENSEFDDAKEEQAKNEARILHARGLARDQLAREPHLDGVPGGLRPGGP